MSSSWYRSDLKIEILHFYPTPCVGRDHVFSVRPFRRDDFGATNFVDVRFLQRSFRRQFGALWQFTYLGFGLGLGLWVSVSKKHRILATKRAAQKWSRRKVVDPCWNCKMRIQSIGFIRHMDMKRFHTMEKLSAAVRISRSSLPTLMMTHNRWA